ncbi:membrane protein [Paractinoplanes abujensis]|uniref:Putative iron-regulated membrane protein n=1 Tax=Paractinoplanes abujensis TaxID=882441 RepID=A0A7W7CP05_9ACTN|nr:PepSY domain-containing protein [Actinoplanes abujensis]MBB4692084.1 putative iron-regulated membrane protein [Actinoplanes abujensis]GID16501.1 membrane protein [Actinoplanes abujensis]
MSTAAPPTVRPAQRSRETRSFGPLLLRLHFYAGIFVAPFLFVAALTGLAYTLTPQLNQLVYGNELTVAAADGTPRPLAEQITAARAAHPDGTIATIRPGTGDATTQLDFDVPGLANDRQHTVYVDPYTAEVKGRLTTWFSYTPLQTWFDDFHRNLQLGDLGRHYSELAASWLAIIALGGLALWWRRQRSARRMLGPELKARKGVRRTRSFHAATGVWLTVGLLFLSATGLTWSRYAGENFSAALDALDSRTPTLSTGVTAPAGGHHGGASGTAAFDPATVDSVIGVARANGLDGPLELTVPADAATAWSVAQNDDTLPVRKDRIAVDSASGTVVDRSDFADYPLLAQATSLGVSAHMGQLFGPANQILLALLALGLLTVIVWGYRMWWQRRPTRSLAGAPPRRGAWLRMPAWGIVAGVPLVFGLAWVVPLFGIPLAAFLLVDVLVGAWRGRRVPPEIPVSPAPAGR